MKSLSLSFATLLCCSALVAAAPIAAPAPIPASSLGDGQLSPIGVRMLEENAKRQLIGDWDFDDGRGHKDPGAYRVATKLSDDLTNIANQKEKRTETSGPIAREAEPIDDKFTSKRTASALPRSLPSTYHDISNHGISNADDNYVESHPSRSIRARIADVVDAVLNKRGWSSLFGGEKKCWTCDSSSDAYSVHDSIYAPGDILRRALHD